MKWMSPFVILFILSSCSKEAITVYECPGMDTTNFVDDIFPILETNCMVSGCHYKFNEYSSVKIYVDNKKLLGAIQHKKGYSPMPKDAAKLPEETIKLISCWVQNGAPEN